MRCRIYRTSDFYGFKHPLTEPLLPIEESLESKPLDDDCEANLYFIELKNDNDIIQLQEKYDKIIISNEDFFEEYHSGKVIEIYDRRRE